MISSRIGSKNWASSKTRLANFQRCQLKYYSLITGKRAVVPAGGFRNDGSDIEVELQDGSRVKTDLVIPATGQIPNNQFLQTLESSTGSPIINATNGFIKVRPTLQFQDPAYPNLFAAGDIADSGAHKAARPGLGQGSVVAQNILAMIEGREPSEKVTITPPAIHLTLGLVCILLFRSNFFKAQRHGVTDCLKRDKT